MANSEHEQAVRNGPLDVLMLRQQLDHQGVQLDLSGSLLWRSDLKTMNLAGANLQNANLGGADLMGTNLCGADLTGAELGTAHLFQTDLAKARLCNTVLVGAFVLWSDLKQADFSGATIGYTTFSNINFSEVRGLASVKHTGPSTVGIETLQLSDGNIPQEFLRGCGLPDTWIEYLPSLIGKVFDHYSCFISHSTKDQVFCDRLHGRLQQEGIRTWYSPHDAKWGRKLHDDIDTAIRTNDKLLLILSPDSMKSEWVKTEIRKARKREAREGKQVLFPLTVCSYDEVRDWEAFDADSGSDMAVAVREYLVGDFSNWKDHDAFEGAFRKLVKDLRKHESASSETGG